MYENVASIACAVLLVPALAAGCSGAGPAESQALPDSHLVEEMYAARHQAASRIAVEREFADLLPNRQFAIDGAPGKPLSEGVVIGRVAAVSPGAAYAVDGDARRRKWVSASSPI